MAFIKVDASDLAGLERFLREAPARVEQAFHRAAVRLGRDGLREWRRVTPKRTGALRRSLRVDVTGRGRLGFHVVEPGEDYYDRIDRRRGMSRRLVAWLRRNAVRYVRAELDRVFGGRQ